MERISARRAIGRLLTAKSEVAIHNMNLEEAQKAHLQLMQAAELMHQGGVMVDFLVASAFDSIAVGQIYKSVDHLNKEQSQMMLRELLAFDARRSNIDNVIYREHVFTQRQMGWLGHLAEFLQRVAHREHENWNIDDEAIKSFHRHQALTRLVALKLAMRAYELDHNWRPTQLAQLVPAYLTTLPTDPFDPTGQPLRFKTRDDQLVLYSVGENGKDDGSIIVTDENEPWMFQSSFNEGDLVLDEEFKEHVYTESEASSVAEPASTDNIGDDVNAR